ncbi:hypothetical protein XBJ2_980004 [Xenorhabdus bovienii str. Jollieti]|uniref:Uncharacterized protein n=1 Tax=Xenorhabdus bovienii (strain SS-2004) TaxID=406818 RepID=D3V2P5_XENBS|nr:DUF4752 family protein [Xenorhabdus bovienii]CBJ81010.1 hypothetical protein XBJ1_1884 [Xenorhabdus bovienii SS-2004]CDH30688.1 hypothetical protein XBJ2_980004 [Xenorhabdus bovienii str. Jollieti]
MPPHIGQAPCFPFAGTSTPQAVNKLYDAFELDQIQDGQTMKIATKGDLVIMMYRQQSESK